MITAATLLLTLPLALGAPDEEIAALVHQALMTNSLMAGSSADDIGRSANLRPDLEVAREVQVAVQAQLASKLSSLSVSCTRGQVTLRGRADDAAVRRQAQDIAVGMSGVREVVNQLTAPEIGIEDQTVTAGRASAQVTNPTEPFTFLSSNGGAASGVVVWVEDGVVTLTGHASSRASKDHATGTARQVTGVRLVRNAMTVRPTDRVQDDLMQRVLVKRFAFDYRLRDSAEGLTITVKDGVATLSGRVDSVEQADQLVQVAVDSKGILAVRDQIQRPAR